MSHASYYAARVPSRAGPLCGSDAALTHSPVEGQVLSHSHLITRALVLDTCLASLGGFLATIPRKA